jgi:hypothetical protein
MKERKKDIMHTTATKKIGRKRLSSILYKGYRIHPFKLIAKGDTLSLTPYTKERFPKNHRVISFA